MGRGATVKEAKGNATSPQMAARQHASQHALARACWRSLGVLQSKCWRVPACVSVAAAAGLATIRLFQRKGSWLPTDTLKQSDKQTRPRPYPHCPHDLRQHYHQHQRRTATAAAAPTSPLASASSCCPVHPLHKRCGKLCPPHSTHAHLPLGRLNNALGPVSHSPCVCLPLPAVPTLVGRASFRPRPLGPVPTCRHCGLARSPLP
jgi:hypothetical protein